MIIHSGISKDQLLEGVFLLLDKPWGWSSYDVVKKVKHLLHRYTRLKNIKVGHAGTLDPLAEGLMILAVGKATKLLQTKTDADKSYRARLQLGETTPSYDLETKPEQSGDATSIAESTIEEILNQFRGPIYQQPPLFSAKRVQGKRAYELARKGSDHQLEPVLVHIHELNLVSFETPELYLDIRCSKGTYIRSLANDLGAALGCGAYLSKLTRTASGEFNLNDALSLQQLEELLQESFPKPASVEANEKQ